MQTSGVKFPFEFCALRYLLQWQRKEADLHRLIRCEPPKPENVRKALRYFQVARNFNGLKDRAELVVGALLKVRARTDLSPVEKVSQLAESFKDAGFQYNLSAASKLLWFSSRRPFVIYDSRALAALQSDYGHTADKRDYEEYCATWKKAYGSHKKAILEAVNRLPTVRAFLPGNTPPDDKLLRLVTKPWFRERVFDIFLWELGGDG